MTFSSEKELGYRRSLRFDNGQSINKIIYQLLYLTLENTSQQRQQQQ